jgi:peptidyl-prolyl cis-trans isomerase D
MLQTIRDRFTGAFAVIIIGAIAVALTITLIDTDTFTGVGNFAARVNGEEIPLTDFRQVAQQQVLEQEQLTRSELPPEARRQIERNVLEGLVRNRVVAQYVREQGYRVDDARVAEHIRGLEAFQVGGQFSSDGYMAALASQGVSPAAFEEERRAALQIEQLQNGLLESSFFTPAEYRRFVTLEGERRRATFAIIDPGPLGAALAPTEADLKAWYDAHPGQFESPESAAIEYVEATIASFAEKGAPTEAELRAAYDANPDRFTTAEQRRASHMLVAVDQDTDDAAAARLAGELRARLERGEDFAALARQYSDDPGSAQAGGDLGWAGKGTYVAAFEEALFAQQPGQVSQPVKTEFGYHVIRLDEVRGGARKSFEDARQELADEIAARGSQDAFFALTEKMDDAALESPGSLDAVAVATGLPVQRIDMFTRQGGGPFAGNRAVIDAAFSPAVLEDGENSPLVEPGEGRAVIVRVAEHRPVKLRPLEEARADVERAWRADQGARLAAERGRGFLEGAQAGGDFASLGSAAGASVISGSQVLARMSQDAPPEVINAIFRAARPAGGRPVHDAVSLPDGRYAVFRVDEVIPGNPGDIPPEQRDARKTILARQSAIAEVTALAVDLRRDADVVEAPNLFEEPDAL